MLCPWEPGTPVRPQLSPCPGSSGRLSGGPSRTHRDRVGRSSVTGMPTRRRSRPGPVRGRDRGHPSGRSSADLAPALASALQRTSAAPPAVAASPAATRRSRLAPVRAYGAPAAGRRGRLGAGTGPRRGAGGTRVLDRGRFGAPGGFGRWAGERLGVRRVHRDDRGHDEGTRADHRRPPHEVAPAAGARRVGSARVVGGARHSPPPRTPHRGFGSGTSRDRVE
jgi:hypothetical protein